MAQEKGKKVVRGELLTKDEIIKLSKGTCPWPHMKAPKRVSAKAETSVKDKRVAG